MKKTGFENGSIVPIGTFALGSSWPTMPSDDRRRDERVYPVLRIGAMNTQSYAEWAYKDKKERAAKIFGGLAAKLRAKRDAV